jgi:hypothetical protein
MLGPARRSLSHVFYALLPGNGLFGTLAGASIGPSALAADWQTTAMTNASVATDILQPCNVLAPLTPQLAFNGIILVQQSGKPRKFILAKISGSCLRINARFMAKFAGYLLANTKKVLQGYDRWFIVRDVNTHQTRHIRHSSIFGQMVT